MKKVLVLAMAVLLVAAFTVPATALDNEFGGYWRTRFFTQQNFTGEDDTEAADLSRVDTRTRLYYTAVINDSLKLVNKFEMDAVWGDDGYGDIGTDGKVFEIKHSFADFDLGDFNFKLGAQGKEFARGFVFSDDFAGLIARYVTDDMIIPFVWMKAYEGGAGKDANDQDVDYYGLDPSFNMGGMKLNPFVLYITSDDASAWGSTTANEEVGVYYLGLNLDLSLDMGGLWLTGVYEGGSVDFSAAAGGGDLDVAAYLFAIGGNVDLGAADVHAEFFYASGDDDATDDEANDFYVPQGQSYYWAEIMGLGTFDNQASANAPGDKISNIMAANLGATFGVGEKLSLTADLWYAQLVEDDAAGNNDLGTEIDLKAKYELVEDLNLEVIAAYLMAGDATYDGSSDADPYELGARLSLKF